MSLNYKRQKQITNIPIPYGTIPKRNKSPLLKAKKEKEENWNKQIKNNSSSAPYPFFSTPNTSSFLSFFSELLFPKEQEHIGFMPCKTTKSLNVKTSPLDIIVPILSRPIDCYYTGKDDEYCYDNTSFFSTSSESTDSAESASSYSSNLNTFDEMKENTDTTTTTLSDILCEHYVQTKMMNQDEVIDIPLETFRMFEAPSHRNQTIHHSNTWLMGKSITSLLEEPKEWTLVEAFSKDAEENQKEVADIVTIEKPIVDTNPKTYHNRDVRSNPDYLRMIVAEVNMMRAEKIVGPLKQRRVLPKRMDPFIHRSSPLSILIVG